MANAPQHRRLKRSVERELQRQPPAKEMRYHTPRWRAVAAMVRERDEWMCQQCFREGGVAQAIKEMLGRKLKKDGVWQPPVDHIKPSHLCTDEEFYDPSNLEVLCVAHNRIKGDKLIR